MPRRERAEYMREYRTRNRQGSEPEAAGSEPEAAPDAGGVPAVPARFAATARLLAGAPMAGPEIPELRVAMALMRLAEDCGYSLESCRLAPAREVAEAP